MLAASRAPIAFPVALRLRAESSDSACSHAARAADSVEPGPFAETEIEAGGERLAQGASSNSMTNVAQQTRLDRPLARPRVRAGILWLSGALVLLGLVTRAAPLLDRGGRLLRQFPTEDGYLMLTIARNVALGHGLSTADGTIPTNGTQPLAALVWAACFKAVGGDKVQGVALIQVIEFVVATLSGWLLFVLGKRLFARHPRGLDAAALGAATWYATMLTVMHGMNCLETGLYVLMLLAFVLVFLGQDGDPMLRWSIGRSIGLGLLLGLVFWCRNDAVFLVLAACLTRAFLRPGRTFGLHARGLIESAIMGATAVVVASPWLVFNQVRFGSIMPISGTAEAFGASFGSNLRPLAIALGEYVFVVLPIPAGIEAMFAALLACVAAIALTVVVIVRSLRGASARTRAFLAASGIYALGLCAYYGFFFGAPHFISRYSFPLSTFLALSWGLVIFEIWDSLALDRSRLLAVGASIVLFALVAYPDVRAYRNGKYHPHFQVVEWIAANVREDEWIGAVQTGTVGFFHDKTINLDGKVNPEALKAVLDRTIPKYVLSKPIRYLADWVGLADEWAKLPEIHDHFDLLVADHDANLAVFRRKD